MYLFAATSYQDLDSAANSPRSVLMSCLLCPAWLSHPGHEEQGHRDKGQNPERTRQVVVIEIDVDHLTHPRPEESWSATPSSAVEAASQHPVGMGIG